MKPKKQVKEEEVSCEYGSDNVFADLGFENPEEELLKADLTSEIADIIKKKKLTQAQAAKIMKITQPRVSSLLKGNTELFSVDTLMHFLNDLGQDIKLIIEPKPKNRKYAYSSIFCPTPHANMPVAAKAHKG